MEKYFAFEKAGYGHYWVVYLSPKRGDYWRALIDDMTLIDDTLNADNATAAAYKRLRRRVQATGAHYNKHGQIIG